MTHTKDDDVLYKTSAKYPLRPYQLDGFGWLSPKTRTITVKSGVHVEMTWDIEEKNCDVVLSPAAPAVPAVPMQPIVVVGGVTRFKENAIVQHLLMTHLSCDMNKLASMDFTDEDRMQFAQLIGYSVEGYADLSYVSDESYEASEKAAHGITKGQP
jgi:hypothetical protein